MEQVGVRRGAERVADHQQRHLFGQRSLQNRLLTALLTELSVGDLDRDTPCLLELLLGHGEHGGVRLQVDLAAPLERVQAPQRDVLLVAEAHAHEVEHHLRRGRAWTGGQASGK